MGSVMDAPQLARINARARPYPAWILDYAETGLSIFSAAFYGQNDAVHFYRNNVVGTCVDTDPDKLWQMAEMYPDGWRFYVEDGWRFAEQHAGEQWDVVSVDPFFDDMAEKAWERLDLWLALARRYVTLTVHDEEDVQTPDGWSSFYFPRNGNAGWLVLERG